MSLFPKDSFKVLAETAGISNLSDDIANALAPDVEYRLREVVQEAIKFMKHSKRSKLATEDVNNALRVLNVETMYGFSSKDSLHFQRIPGTKDLFCLEDRQLEFNDIINSPLPKAPRETSISSHWLAIEGVQPPIPQNPLPLPSTASILESPKKNQLKVLQALQKSSHW